MLCFTFYTILIHILTSLLPYQGIIVAPTSLVMGTTLDCTFCTKTHCEDITNNEEDPGLNIYFVRRNCALEELSPIILYFPYFLLIIATVLVMMDRLVFSMLIIHLILFNRPFVMILFKSFNMAEIYKLLVVDDPYSQDFDRKKEAIRKHKDSLM